MDWLRADEVSVALGKAIGHTYVIAHREDWARITVGGRLFYSRLDVEKYIEKRKEKNERTNRDCE